MSNPKLPQPVLGDIILRIGRRSFRDLGPFLLAGREGRQEVYNSRVLKEANVGELLCKPEYIRGTSNYHAFLRRCALNGNEIASLFEGLRLAYSEGDLPGAIAIIQRNFQHSFLVNYVLGMLWICAGSYPVGFRVLSSMRWWEDIRKFNMVGNLAVSLIVGLRPPMKWTFKATFDCPEPGCQCEEAAQGSCVLCCLYYNARRMMSYS